MSTPIVTAPPLLEAVHLVRDYPMPRAGLFERPSFLRALAGVTLSIERGTSMGLIGESGSGKSTFARLVVGLEKPDAGSVSIDGQDLFSASPARLRTLRRRLAMVFQDPYGSTPVTGLPGSSMSLYVGWACV